MESQIYNQTGGAAGTIKLPESVFGLPWNADLVHQVVTSMRSNARKPIAHTKDRGEVSGGGKKPWQQKGTGRARHGSIRSPIWVHGGVAHGPTKEKNFARKINRRMKAKALAVILSKKFKDGEVLFVDAVSLPEQKTKAAKEILKSLCTVKGFEKILAKKSNSAILALGTKDAKLEKSFRNFGNLLISEARNMNPVELLNYKHLVIIEPEKTVEFLASKLKA